MKIDNQTLNVILNVSILILISLGVALPSGHKKWTIIDATMSLILSGLIYLNYNTKYMPIYVCLLVLLIAMKVVQVYKSKKSLDKFYAIFDGMLLGVAGTYLTTHFLEK